jgi:disulfide bond formation protein DsbB
MKEAKKYLRLLAFTVAILAVSGSLFTSTQLGWDTCTLCLWQRFFMYPVPVIIGAAILNDTNWERWAVYALTGIGAVFSFAHFLLVWLDPTQTCGFALPCSFANPLYIGSFGFRPVFLPLLAFLGFGVIFASYLFYQPNSEQGQ